MFNTKNKKIINKFNKALRIIADYYNLDVEAPAGKAYYKYDFISLEKSHILVTNVTDYKRQIDLIVNSKYEYLVPFYKVWMAEVDKLYAEQVTKETFEEINEIIKKINNKGLQ